MFITKLSILNLMFPLCFKSQLNGEYKIAKALLITKVYYFGRKIVNILLTRRSYNYHWLSRRTSLQLTLSKKLWLSGQIFLDYFTYKYARYLSLTWLVWNQNKVKLWRLLLKDSHSFNHVISNSIILYELG